MKRDENVEDYIHDILRRTQKLDLSDEESMSIFIAGLRDDLRKHVILNHPTSFDMASNLAYEKYLVENSFSENPSQSASVNYLSKDIIREAIREELSSSSQEPEVVAAAFSRPGQNFRQNQYKQPQTKPRDFRNQEHNRNQGFQQNDFKKNFNWQPFNPQPDMKQQPMGNSNEATHSELAQISARLKQLEDLLLQKARPFNNNTQQRFERGPVECFHCHELGHISRFCPEKLKQQDEFGQQIQQREPLIQNSSINFLSSLPPTLEHDNELEMSKPTLQAKALSTKEEPESLISIESKGEVQNMNVHHSGPEETCDKSPVKRNADLCTVDCCINNVQVLALVDTGASISIVTQECLQKCWSRTDISEFLVSPSIQKVSSVTGQPIPILGEASLDLALSGYTYSCNALVVETSSYPLILGRDFLFSHKARINLDDNSLHLTPIEEPICTVNSNETAPVPIRLEHAITVPGRSECIFPVNLMNFVEPETTGMIEISERISEIYNVFGAHALVKVSDDGTIPFRVMNPNSHKVTLYRGALLGHFDQSFEADTPNSEINFVSNDKQAVSEPEDCPVEISENTLTDEQNNRLRSLLIEFKDVFSSSDSDLGRTSIIKHKIDTGDHPPIRLRAYRTSPIQRQNI